MDESQKLRMSRSLDLQLGYFRGLHLSDPERARAVHALNEELVLLCKEGSLRRVKQLVEAASTEDLMTYFVVRAFKAALLGSHLVLVDYLLSHGYPLNSSGVPYALLEVIADMAGDPGQRDDSLAIIFEFLLARRWNVNMQASKTWISALHVAVQYSLLRSTEVLVGAGGDVNSVAAGDVMPLSVAEDAVRVLSSAEAGAPDAPSAAARADMLRRAEAVRELLLAHGARATWRRHGEPTARAGAAPSPSSASGHVFGTGGESVGIRAGGGGASASAGGAGEKVRFTGAVGGVAAGGGGGMVRFVGGGGPTGLALTLDATSGVGGVGGGAGGGGGMSISTRLSSAVSTGSGGEGERASHSMADDGGQLFSTGD